MKQGPEVNIKEMLTDPKAIMDGVVPPVLFVGVNALTKDIQTAAVIAGGFGLVVAAYRLIKHQKINYVLGGLLGLGLSIFLALRSGNASDYFLPNTYIGFAYGGAALVSVIVARPLSAFLARTLEEKPKQWYSLPRVRMSHQIVTGTWAVVFLARSGFRYMLIQQGREGELAATAVLLGFPVVAALTAGSWAFLKWRHGHEPVPEHMLEVEPVEPLEPIPSPDGP
ncbi:MAG: DUF3159 domain-containing protein [Actinomycetota bacterium]